MRKNSVLSYLLSDHLGSTSLVTDASGTVISSQYYKAWGEIRYSSGTNPTDYTYTGQYSYASDFGLHFYNARWYDSSLSRFAQADTIVPSGVQGLDRYAYTNNNPINYTDPSGHDAWWCEGNDSCHYNWLDDNTKGDNEELLFGKYDVIVDAKMSSREKRAIMAGIYAFGQKISDTRNQGESASDAFKKIFEPVNFKKSDKDYKGCVFQDANNISCSDFTFDDFQSDVNNVVHELGHVFNAIIGGSPNDLGLQYAPLRDWILRPDFGIDWQQHPTPPDPSGGEMFGDMLVAWVFNAWNTSPNPLVVNYVNTASADMNSRMKTWLNR